MTATSHVARVFNDRAPQRKKLLVFTRDGHPEDAALLRALEGSFDIEPHALSEAAAKMHHCDQTEQNPWGSDYAAIVCFGEPTKEFTHQSNPLQVFLLGLSSLNPPLRNRPILLVGESPPRTRAEQYVYHINPSETEAADHAVAWLTARILNAPQRL